MTKYEATKVVLASHDFHVRIYSGNPDRYEIWADGECQGSGWDYPEMDRLTHLYLDRLEGKVPKSKGKRAVLS